MRLPRLARALVLAPYLAVFYPFLALRRAAAALRPGHSWRTWIHPHILLGGFLVPADVDELRRAGVHAVLNVSTELLDPVRALREAGIDYLRIPCWDTRPPSVEAADQGVRFIADHVARGHRVYVHCASGVGRSVVLSLCYLATVGGLELAEALDTVHRLRPRVALRPPQREFIDCYIARHRSRSAARP